VTPGGSERRRAAPVATESSDVTRFRAFGAAAFAFVLGVLGVLAFRGGAAGLFAPGPLALPHRDLACVACHERKPGERAASACTGCHGPHPSARPAHAALARSGELDCGVCHAVHRAESGLAFEPDGGVVHYGTGFARALDSAELGVTSGVERTLVPLVAARACMRCHELERASDPAWACFAGDARSGHDASRCFDEHRPPGARSGASPAARDAAVERARELLPRLRSERAEVVAWNGSALIAGALSAGLVLGLSRRRSKRPGRPSAPAVASRAPGARRLPVIDTARCLGCQACVDACPYDVLEMSRYVAVVARAEQCCGAGPCLLACPNGSLVFGDAPAKEAAPRLGARLELLERPGIFLAGDVAGGSLIRSALEQGAAAAAAVAEELAARRLDAFSPSSEPNAESWYDVLVVGAGPAGLAAGLEATERGLRVVVLEQASIAESIRRFSREKLVQSTSPDGNGSLPLWIGDCMKEELLRRWLRDVRARGLAVREDARVVGIDRIGHAGSRVRAAGPTGEAFELFARRVVLATGRRGSPRKLEASIPEPALGRVHYELSDARAFAGRRTVVVGLGDVAMETALALALQPGTAVTLLHRGAGFSRGRQKNVEAVGKLVAEGRVGLLFGATVQSIGLERIVVEVEKRKRTLAYDALFVHIGAEAPARFPIA
jgi:thioredoxin reductase/NAD-dependent dihydropyrimidine dehydrogenase PreA subunit